MRRVLTICGAMILALTTLMACGPDPEVRRAEARDAEWQALQQADQELDAKRQELAEARAAAAAEAAAAEGEEEAAEAEAAEGEGEAEAEAETATAESAADRVAALEAEVEEQATAFIEQLVTFINANPPVQGEPLTERQTAAIRMKSDEDILIAQEFITEGGDYARAVRIFQDALVVDPENERLQQALAEAEDMRFVTEERFAGIDKGMNPDEVRQILGPVNLRNVRQYPEKNATAWFYPRDESGSAAAVWFQENKRTGELNVYQSDFHFRDAGDEEEAEG